MALFGKLFGRAGRGAPLRLKSGDAFAACREKYGITAREGEIIRLLIEGKDNKAITGELFISDHTVKNHIHHVYQKLGIKNRVQLIQCFRAALEESGPATPGEMTAKLRRKKLIGPVLIAAFLVLAAVAFWLLGPKKSSAPPTGPKSSIAVLPFVDLSPAKDYEYLCDGISETLINALTHIDGLWVPARTSSFFFKGKTQDIPDIGRKLGVDHILEGSVQVSGDDLRITARIGNVRDGRQLWSDIFNRKLPDLFSIQDDIAQRIVEALKITVLGEKPVQVIKRFTGNLEAYDLYMKGIYFYNKRGQENLEKALGFFRSATAIDPQYALAYAWIAETYTVIGSWSFLPPREAFSGAREAAEKALDLDSSLAEAYSALADVTYLFDWDWNKAEVEFKKALECNPRYAIAHSSYAQFLACLGRFEEALKEHELARELDPLSLMIRGTTGNTLAWMGQYDRAIDELNQVLELDPDYGPAREYLHQARLKRLLAEENYEEALQECQKSDDLLGMGIVYARMGRKTEGRIIADQYIVRSQKDLNDAYAAAVLLLALGENDRGFEFLERAYEYRSRRMVFLKTSPYFDAVRQDPRFLALLKKIGLEN